MKKTTVSQVVQNLIRQKTLYSRKFRIRNKKQMVSLLSSEVLYHSWALYLGIELKWEKLKRQRETSFFFITFYGSQFPNTLALISTICSNFLWGQEAARNHTKVKVRGAQVRPSLGEKERAIITPACYIFLSFPKLPTQNTAPSFIALLLVHDSVWFFQCNNSALTVSGLFV